MVKLHKKKQWNWIQETEEDHLCKRCGKIIPKGSCAKMNGRRQYVHAGKCKYIIKQLCPGTLDEPEL